jgi:hypothetical protein
MLPAGLYLADDGLAPIAEVEAFDDASLHVPLEGALGDSELLDLPLEGKQPRKDFEKLRGVLWNAARLELGQLLNH